MKKVLFSIGLFFLLCGSAYAACPAGQCEVTCDAPSSPITTALQDAIDSAIDDDIINIGSGSCSSASVSWSNKNITVQGQGDDSTYVSLTGTTLFSITATTKAKFVIKNMDITTDVGDGNTIYIYHNQATPTGGGSDGFRITGLTMHTDASGSSNRLIMILGLVFGVIDNCDFDQNQAGNVIAVESYYNSSSCGSANPGCESWEDVALGLGGDSAVYIEYCTFDTGTADTGETQSWVVDSYYGSRVVFRYNTVVGRWGAVSTHWAGNSNWSRGPLKFEVYENTFNNINAPIQMHGGTGVIYNNTFNDSKAITIGDRRSCLQVYTTNCDGNDSTHDGNVSDNGWPCSDQIGRGGGAWGSQPSLPLYLWNNGGATAGLMGGCFDGGTLQASHVKSTAHANGEVDYCEHSTTMPSSCGTHTNTYSPYTYHHPLRGEAEVVPANAIQGVTIN